MEIDAEKLERMRTLHVAFLLFDLRSSLDFMTDHIKGAVNIVHDEFVSKIATMIPDKSTPVVVYDGDGIGAAQVVVEVEKLGYLNVVNLEGGFQAYKTFLKRPRP